MEDIVVNCKKDYVLVAHDNILTVKKHNREEFFKISELYSFDVKEPHGLTMGIGTIIFQTNQMPTDSLNLGLGLSTHVGATKVFTFNGKEYEAVKKMREYIVGIITGTTGPAAPAPQKETVVSVVDEIRGLKGLLDEGILTQEEFDAKKRQLLGI